MSQQRANLRKCTIFEPIFNETDKMKNKTYVVASSCISSQKTFDDRDWRENLDAGANTFRCIEPNFGRFIDASSSRRMNGMQKLVLCAALDCLQKAGVASPDAIVFATGTGCIDSTYKVLERLFDRRNLSPNPATFIQSTHNSPSAATALKLGCKGVNLTFADNETPFETALDAALDLMDDSDISNLLLAACDELTPRLTEILQKLSMFGNSVPLPPGEGCTSFLLSKERTNASAEIKRLVTVPLNQLGDTVAGLVAEYSAEQVFTPHREALPSNIHQTAYAHLFGNFPSLSACGFFLALDCMEREGVENVVTVARNRCGIAYIAVAGKPERTVNPVNHSEHFNTKYKL
jgi:hypothetical protein